MLILTFVAPFLTFYFFKRYYLRLREDTFVNRVGALYRDITIKRFLNLMPIIFYMIRRLVISFVIVFMHEMPFA